MQLKLIQSHQEIRTLQNHNMVKFRALLGEASLHKKGTCSESSQHDIAKKEQTNEDQKSSISVNVAPNNLNWIGL
jgi:hypothetical protein